MLFSLAIYVVSAFAFYKLAKIRCIPNAWMAFIPFFSLYIIGYIGDTLKYNNSYVSRYLGELPLAYALPIGSVIASFTWAIPLVGNLAGDVLQLLIYVAQIVIYYLVFEQYTDQSQKVLFTALSIIPLVGPLLIIYSLREYQNY